MCLAATLVLVSTLLSTTVAAQKDAFRDALIGFHAKLSGDYGDEGPLAVEDLEKMSVSLAAWDETIRGMERSTRSRLPSASSAERARMHTTLAEVYVERGRYADAIRELDEAVQADGSRGAAHALRGIVFEAMGRRDDAVSAFRRAWEVDRDDPVNAYMLASRLATHSDADEMSPQAGALLRALDRRFASVPPDRHIALFSELWLLQDGAATTPVFSPALYADGFTLIAEGRYDEAIASFRRSITGDPLVIGAPARLAPLRAAISKLRDGDAEHAIPDLEAAAAASARSSELRRILGAAYADVDNGAKSIEQLDAAVALARDDERASVALGRALAHAGQTERAERVLTTAIATLPQSADAHSALADLYEDSGRGRDALHEVELASSFTVIAGKSALYLRLGDLEHRHLEYARVIDPLTHRVRLNPNDARAHTDLALAEIRIGRTNDALVELLIASLIGPEDAEALTAIGQIHFDEERYAQAEPVLRRAIALAPTQSQARYLLGHTLARLGRASESKEQLGEYDRLRATLNDDTRRAFEIDVLRQEATRATKAGRDEEAIAALQQVVEREPASRDDHVALAAALLRAGRPSVAITELLTAARLRADPGVYRQLADAYAAIGRGDESAKARETYLRLLREQRREN